MNSVPISPSFHALISAASEAMEQSIQPAPLSLAAAAAQHAASAATPSPASSHHSSGSSLFHSSNTTGRSLTGMSILQQLPNSNRMYSSLLSPPKPSGGASGSLDETDAHSPGSSSDDANSLASTASAASFNQSHVDMHSQNSQQSPRIHSSQSHLPSSSPPLHSSFYTPKGSHTVSSPYASPTLTASSPNNRKNSASATGSPLLTHMKGSRRGSHASLSLSSVSFRQSKKVSSLSSSESSGGSSCHQCKSRRNYGDLTYCTSSLHKKNKNAICRKKYCEHCLKKFYRENPAPAGTPASTLWKCPSCRKICCCAACRRREMRDGGTVPPLDENGAPILGSMSMVSSPRPNDDDDVDSDGEDARMSPMDQTQFDRSPSPINMNALLLSPHTPGLNGLEKLPAAALHNHSHDTVKKEHRENSHRTLLSVTHSPALTALSQAAAASSLNSDFHAGASILKPASVKNHTTSEWFGLNRSRNQIGMAVSGHSPESSRRRFQTSDHSESDSSSEEGTSHNDTSDADHEAPSKSFHSIIKMESIQALEQAAALNHLSSIAPPRSSNVLSSFMGPSISMMFALQQMPSVQLAIQNILRKQNLTNAMKLKEIDDYLAVTAACVRTEEFPLTIE